VQQLLVRVDAYTDGGRRGLILMGMDGFADAATQGAIDAAVTVAAVAQLMSQRSIGCAPKNALSSTSSVRNSDSSCVGATASKSSSLAKFRPWTVPPSVDVTTRSTSVMAF